MLDGDDRLDRALAVAYRYLNRRDRTRAEVRGQLEAKCVDTQTSEQAIETLCAQGYLDDSRFARLFVQGKRELEQWGSHRIRRRLLDLGVAREVVEDALGSGVPAHMGGTPIDSEQPEALAGDELDRALTLLRRRFSTPPCDTRSRRRALGVLLRKGYDAELALAALADFERAAHSR